MPGTARRGGGGRRSDIFLCGGIRGQTLCFRVITGVITSDKYRSVVYCASAVMCVCVCGGGGGGGGKVKLGFFFWVHFRILGGIATI